MFVGALGCWAKGAIPIARNLAASASWRMAAMMYHGVFSELGPGTMSPFGGAQVSMAVGAAQRAGASAVVGGGD